MSDRQVIVVTGAAGGIGSAVVDALAASGRQVVTTDLPGRSADIDLDVRDAAAAEAAVRTVVERHGRVDGLAAIAGVGVAGPVETLSEGDWRMAVDVNLWGVIHAVRAVYPRLVAQGSGHIAVLASLSGLVATPLLVPYAMTKSALVGLVSSMAPEARRQGVTMSAICPGPVDTPMLDHPGPVNVRRYLTAAAGPALAPAAIGKAVAATFDKPKLIITPGRAALLSRLARYAPGATARTIAKTMAKELDQH